MKSKSPKIRHNSEKDIRKNYNEHDMNKKESINKNLSSGDRRRRKFEEEKKVDNKIVGKKHHAHITVSRSPIHQKSYKSQRFSENRKFERKRSSLTRDKKNNKPNPIQRSPLPISSNQSLKSTQRSFRLLKNDQNSLNENHPRFDQTEFNLNDRFSSLAVIKPLVIDENISVEIERNIPGGEKFQIPKVLEASAVVLVRRSGEGKQPFCLRSEFIDTKLNYDEKQKVDRDISERLRKRIEPPKSSKFHSHNPDYNKRRRIENHKDGSHASKPGNQHVSIDNQHKFHDKIASGDTAIPSLISSRVFDRLGTLSGLKYEELESKKKLLPDFSKRPGKYSYEVWKDTPEITPRGRSYFEHDDRDASLDDTNSNLSNSARRPVRSAPGFNRPRIEVKCKGLRSEGAGYTHPSSPYQRNKSWDFKDRDNNRSRGGLNHQINQWAHDKYEEIMHEEVEGKEDIK